MNIFLWVLQVLVAVYCIMGAVWRFFNYESAAKGVPSVQALSAGTWNVIGLVEIVLALGLLLPGLLGLKGLTAIAATALTVELLLVTALHAKFYGLKFETVNPAIWTLGLAIMVAFVAYGRFVLRPL